MKSFSVFMVLAITAVSGQRRGRQQAPSSYGVPSNQQQPEYGEPRPSPSEASHSSDHQGLDWLLNSVPGTPGTDYPILAEVPETGFDCSGQVEGGYYADTEAQCQVFHVCSSDGFGGLAKYSFLCPNGTIFNQGYFICDWWFNFDCSQAEGLYSKNEEISAEREQNSVSRPSSGSPSFNPPPSSGGGRAPTNSYSEPPLGTYGRQSGK